MKNEAARGRVRELERENLALRRQLDAWQGLAQSVFRFIKAHIDQL